MPRKCRKIALLILFGFMSACGQVQEPLTVYSGKGLKAPMEEIKTLFEQREGIRLTIHYAGSQTLLRTIRKTLKGDVFIPGSAGYIRDAGDLVTDSRYVAPHVPVFAVSADSSIKLTTYSDLLKPGLKIAVGNKETAAIGRVTEAILKSTPEADSFRSNIVISASTVNELMDLVASRKVDAALVWKDMLRWETAKGLRLIDIPSKRNQIKEIFIGVLSVSDSPVEAGLFADFVSTEGKAIFTGYGFSVD